MDERRLTRAEIAAHTGLSKPTVSDSVRRLSEAGMLRDTGERTSGRGRIGSYYALTENTGCALVAGIAPEGVVAEALDAHGTVLCRAVEDVQRPATPAEVASALVSVTSRALEGAARPA